MVTELDFELKIPLENGLYRIDKVHLVLDGKDLWTKVDFYDKTKKRKSKTEDYFQLDDY